MKYLSSLDWNHIVTAIIAFVLGLIIKTLLDLDLAKFIVKWFYWLPVRFIFRDKPADLSGDWEQIWDFSAIDSAFSEITERHSHTEIKQFGSYCYSEFYSGESKYFFFGVISNNYIRGKWGDIKDKFGYHGVFELEIKTSKSLEGKWIGHRKKGKGIDGDNWIWKKRK